MSHSRNELTLPQIRAAQLIATGRSIRQTAKEINHPVEAVRKWSYLKEFQQYVIESTMDFYRDAVSELSTKLRGAVDELDKIVTNPEIRPYDKLKAIELMFKVMSDYRANLQQEERLQALESQIERLNTIDVPQFQTRDD